MVGKCLRVSPIPLRTRTDINTACQLPVPCAVSLCRPPVCRSANHAKPLNSKWYTTWAHFVQPSVTAILAFCTDGYLQKTVCFVLMSTCEKGCVLDWWILKKGCFGLMNTCKKGCFGLVSTCRKVCFGLVNICGKGCFGLMDNYRKVCFELLNSCRKGVLYWWILAEKGVPVSTVSACLWRTVEPQKCASGISCVVIVGPSGSAVVARAFMAYYFFLIFGHNCMW